MLNFKYDSAVLTNLAALRIDPDTVVASRRSALAASGYGLASWFLGIKISRWMIVAILALQLIAYFAAQYIDYRDIYLQLKQALAGSGADVEKFTFFHYWDRAARSLAWQGKNGELEAPLGVWGYGLRALEISGFGFGGLIAPLTLWSHPFCDRCQRYMRGKEVIMVPASLPEKLFHKIEKADKEKAAIEGEELLNDLKQKAGSGDINGFRAALSALKPRQKEVGSLPFRYSLQIMRCPGCSDGFLRVAIETRRGTRSERKVLPERIPLTPDFVKAFS